MKKHVITFLLITLLITIFFGNAIFNILLYLLNIVYIYRFEIALILFIIIFFKYKSKLSSAFYKKFPKLKKNDNTNKKQKNTLSKVFIIVGLIGVIFSIGFIGLIFDELNDTVVFNHWAVIVIYGFFGVAGFGIISIFCILIIIGIIIKIVSYIKDKKHKDISDEIEE